MNNEKSLSKGTTCPPLEEGKIRIYSMRFCPFSERARLVLAHKNIPHDIVNINLQQKPDWYFDKNPLGTTPTLEQDDKLVFDSGICCEYLDDSYDTNKLYATNPYAKAQQKMLIERFCKVTSPMHKLYANPPKEDRQVIYEEMFKGLSVFEKLLNETYFGGEEVSMVDLSIWPWFERIPMFSTVFSEDLLPKDRFPKLSSWVKSMKNTAAVRTCSLSDEVYLTHIKTYFDGKPDDNVGL